ncbi:hypothetical protein PG999_013704 [Apiospora kogelbergensis]|uniref:Uncharacterized protein n=1 Tax=Apiospora kogelbergensis TaxID=1337665 RepID=A0AAW0QG09_9PEZI
MTSLYNLSIPVLTEVLQTTRQVLEKGEAFARARGLDPETLLSERVYPDMFDLRLQITVILVVARTTINELAGGGQELAAKITERGQSLEKMYTLLDKTLAQLTTVRSADVDGKERVEVSCWFFNQCLRCSALDFVQKYALPTVYFHLSVTYAILRSKGAPLGKKDYVAVFMKDFALPGAE